MTVNTVVVQLLVTTVLLGSVIIQLTVPVGCSAPPARPVTVVVKVTGELSTGLADAAKVIIGACAAKVTVS